MNRDGSSAQKPRWTRISARKRLGGGDDVFVGKALFRDIRVGWSRITESYCIPVTTFASIPQPRCSTQPCRCFGLPTNQNARQLVSLGCWLGKVVVDRFVLRNSNRFRWSRP